ARRCHQRHHAQGKVGVQPLQEECASTRIDVQELHDTTAIPCPQGGRLGQIAASRECQLQRRTTFAPSHRDHDCRGLGPWRAVDHERPGSAHLRDQRRERREPRPAGISLAGDQPLHENFRNPVHRSPPGHSPVPNRRLPRMPGRLRMRYADAGFRAAMPRIAGPHHTRRM
ncbi:MAG: hypothetical protein AVDCRST_MAG87-1381, partial [uncultured Thermomicrobiales bacterium]